MRRVTLDLIARWLRDYKVRGPVADCGGAFPGYYRPEGLPAKPLFDVAGIAYKTVDLYNGADVVCDLCKRVPLDRWGAVMTSDTLMYVEDPISFGANLAMMIQPGGMLLATAQEAGVRRGNPEKDYFRFTSAGLALVFSGFEPLECGDQEDPERNGERFVYLIGRRR